MSLRIAYFVNLYPAVSHTFIRREIHALERLGFEVKRIALRGWEGELVDPLDFAERAKTHFVLQEGYLPVIRSLIATALRSPGSFFHGIRLALKMSRLGGRGLLHHLGYLAEACRILPWLDESEVSHVHAHFGTNSAEVAMLANVLGGPPYSFTVHGPDEFDMPRQLGLAEKVRRSVFTVAITSYARAQLFRWIRRDDWNKVKLVSCGIDTECLRHPPVPIPDVPRLVCVGRLAEQKGHLLLLEAARQMAKKGLWFELVFVGDGPLRAELESLIDEYGLSERVRLTGSIDQASVRSEMLASRGLVLPSFAEGLPVVIMEAMALRRPVLTTCIAGIPELVQPGECGWLISAGDAEHLERAMTEFLYAPLDRLEEMGTNAYERVSERHDIDRQAAVLGGLISSVSCSKSVPLTRGIS